MTRQETVIKITKITRIVGEMKSQLDLDDEIEFEALDSSWMNIGKWAEEICQYMQQAPLSSFGRPYRKQRIYYPGGKLCTKPQTGNRFCIRQDSGLLCGKYAIFAVALRKTRRRVERRI